MKLTRMKNDNTSARGTVYIVLSFNSKRQVNRAEKFLSSLGYDITGDGLDDTETGLFIQSSQIEDIKTDWKKCKLHVNDAV